MASDRIFAPRRTYRGSAATEWERVFTTKDTKSTKLGVVVNVSDSDTPRAKDAKVAK
jgi:hypothetical protein